MSRIIKTNKLSKSLKKNIISVLKSGGIIAFPTDTVYGIAALPKHKKAVNKLFKIKKRSASKPIPILLSSKIALKNIARNIPNVINKLIKKHWPGALTVIVQKNSSIPSYITKGSNNVAVRMPNNKLALQIIKAAGGYLAVTSANISGKKAAVSVKEMKKLKEIDLIIDGGRSKIGKASTIVAFIDNQPVVLRKGSVKL